MENKFEQFIKQSMEHPPEHAFEERLWQDMEGRLNYSDKGGKGSGLRRSLPWFLLTLFMTSLAGFFYVKHYKAMERIAVVEEQLAAVTTPLIKLDEPVRESIVLYDTIYRTVMIDEYVRGRVDLAVAKNTGPHTVDFMRTIAQLSDLKRSVFEEEGLGIRHFAESNDWGVRVSEEGDGWSETNEGRAYAFDWTNAADEVPSLLLQEDLKVERLTTLPELQVMRNKQKKNVKFYLNHLRPTRFSLAGTTGTFASLNLGGSGFNLRGSAHAEVGLGSRFSLLAGVEYFSNDFTKTIEEEDLIEGLEGFPELPANNDEDVLTEIQGDFNYLQIPFGVKYVIFPFRYVDPYLGLGLVYGKTTRSRLEYEYLSPIGPYSVSEGRLLPNLFEMNALYGTIGVQIQMNRHWSLLLEGSGQMDIKQGVYKYENLELLKLNTGVIYKF